MPRLNASGGQPLASKVDLVVPVRAVSLGSSDSRHRQLKQALARSGVATHLVDPNSAAPFALIEKDPRISVLGVRVGELGRRQQDSLLSLIYDQPGLTVFVIGAIPAYAKRLRELGVRHLFDASVPPHEIAQAVVESLSDHHIDSTIAESLGSTLSRSLIDTDMALTELAPFMRVSASLLGHVSAIVVIGGDDISGRVVVAGPKNFFERVSRGWLGKKPATKEMLWDAAGELCNRATGLVRAHYASRGLNSRQATPTIIEGNDAAIRGMTAKPGLVVPFEVKSIAEPAYIELVVAAKVPDRDPDPPDDPNFEPLPAGEMTFL